MVSQTSLSNTNIQIDPNCCFFQLCFADAFHFNRNKTRAKNVKLTEHSLLYFRLQFMASRHWVLFLNYFNLQTLRSTWNCPFDLDVDCCERMLRKTNTVFQKAARDAVPSTVIPPSPKLPFMLENDHNANWKYFLQMLLFFSPSWFALPVRIVWIIFIFLLISQSVLSAPYILFPLR